MQPIKNGIKRAGAVAAGLMLVPSIALASWPSPEEQLRYALETSSITQLIVGGLAVALVLAVVAVGRGAVALYRSIKQEGARETARDMARGAISIATIVGVAGLAVLALIALGSLIGPVMSAGVGFVLRILVS